MASNQSVEEILVRIRLDRANAARLDRALAKTEKQLKSIGKTSKKAFQDDMTKAAKNATSAQNRLNKSLDETIQKTKEAGGAAKDGRGITENKGTIRTGIAIRNLPAIGPSETIAKATTTLGRLGLSIGQVGLAGVLAIPSIIAFAEGIRLIKKDIKDSADAARVLIDIRNQEAEQELAREELADTRTAEANRKVAAAQLASIISLEGRIVASTARRDQAIDDFTLDFSGKPVDVIGVLKARDVGAQEDVELLRLKEELFSVSSAYQETILHLGPLIDIQEIERDTTQQLTEAAIRATTAAERRLQEDLKVAKVSEQSVETIEAMVAAIDTDIAAREAAIAGLQASGIETEETRIAIENYSDAIRFLRSEQERFNEEAIPAARIREALEAEKKQREDTADAIEAFNEDVADIEADAMEKRADLARKFNDSLVDIAQKAADSAEDALRKLEDRRVDLGSGLGRDQIDAQLDLQNEQLDAQIDFQREEARSAREHADDLVSIRNTSQRAEQDAIGARDAVALFRARQQTSDSIREANTQHQAERRERLITFRQERSDNVTQFRREQAQRLVKYARDLADAQLQFDRENLVININRQRSLRDLNTNLQRELKLLNAKESAEQRLLRASAIAKIKIISLGTAAALRLEEQFQRDRIIQAQRMMLQPGHMGSGQLAPAGIPGFARGGNAPAHKDIMVGERGPEVLRLPRPGRIMTAQQLRGDQSGGGLNVSFSITGQTRTQVKREVMRTLETVLDAAEVT